MSTDKRTSPSARAAALSLAGGLLLALALLAPHGAAGQDLQSELDSKQAQLNEEQEKEGVLSSELAHWNDRVDQLAGEVAVLRNREAIVQAELDRVKTRLRREKDRLEWLKHQLTRSLNVLRRRLVSIYRSDEPDVLTVMLEADGFEDLVSRYEYLRRIEEQDADIVGRVRGLRNESRDTVERIEAARDEIAARKAELVRTRVQLEAREAELAAVRDRKAAALDEVHSDIERLEGDISDIQGQIQAQISAASSTTPLPGGPDPGREQRLDLAGQRAGHLAVRPALGAHARGPRHRGAGGHPDPRRQLGHGDPRRADERLRQLHLHRPRRWALLLLRASVELRDQRRRDGEPGRRDRLRRLHRKLLRGSPALRDPGQRGGGRPARVPVAGSLKLP